MASYFDPRIEWAWICDPFEDCYIVRGWLGKTWRLEKIYPARDPDDMYMRVYTAMGVIADWFRLTGPKFPRLKWHRK